MEIKKKLSVYVLYLFACTFFFTGCKKDVYDPNKNTPIKDAFDYATTKVTPIAVDYGIKGNKAVFEVYDENPLVSENGFSKKKEGVTSLLKVYTDENSNYTGKINLPTATSKVYLYSESYGLPTCVETDVTESGIKFNLEDYIVSLKTNKNRTAKQTSKQLARLTSQDNRYNVQQINSWEVNDGSPSNVKVDKGQFENAKDIFNRIQNTLLPGTDNRQYAKPTEEVNINVLENTSVTLVFAGELAQYKNTLGYYYYETGKAPKNENEFRELPKYIAFPNCTISPLIYGMRMNLLYHDKEGNATETFPKGTTIGWFIISDGFYGGDVDLVGKSYWFSNNEFNPNEDKRCVSLYDKETKNIILGFEDGDNRSAGNVDYDYKDVLFFLTNEDGNIDISDKPTTNPEDYPPVTTIRKGTLAFEDLWPNQGDYDMNDVVITYERSFSVDKDNNVTELKDIYTPVHKGGQIKSGFGYQIEIQNTNVSEVKIENGGSKAQNIINNMESGQEKVTLILFDDMEQVVINEPITVTIKAKGLKPETIQGNLHFYNPFIRVSPNKEGKNPIQEIHLTNYPPTALADLTYFGRYKDHSSLDEDGNLIGPYYYVSEDEYPFAIDLPIMDYKVPTEAMRINLFYPKFGNWVKTKGQEDADWYNHPIE